MLFDLTVYLLDLVTLTILSRQLVSNQELFLEFVVALFIKKKFSDQIKIIIKTTLCQNFYSPFYALRSSYPLVLRLPATPAEIIKRQEAVSLLLQVMKK